MVEKEKALKSLINLQMDKILEKRGVGNYRETYSKDTLAHKSESLVINLKDYFDGNGIHWVVIYNDGVKM